MEQLSRFSGIAHWLPRVSLAATFLYHGIGKFPMAQMMADGMGMPLVAIYLVGAMETVGAVLIIWGGFGPDWATRVAGLLFVPVMLGAIFTLHLQNGWSFAAGFGEGTNNMGGMEFQVLIIMVSLFFVFKGNSINKGTEAAAA